MNQTITNNSNEEINPSQLTINSNSEEKTSIDNLISLFLRRKKFFILGLIIATFLSVIQTTKEKITNSIFKGEFSILVTDPIRSLSANPIPGGVGDLASNFVSATALDLEQDIPTLREVLLSDAVLKDLSTKYNLNPKSLSQQIKIKIDQQAKGILNVSLLSNNPKTDQQLLEDLSILYVNYASSRTQKKLSDGLAFLSNQEPAIKIKNSELLKKLETFRRESNLVDPLAQGNIIKNDLNRLKNEISELEQSIESLKNIKKDILVGKVNFSNYLQSVGGADAAAVKIINPEEKLIAQITELNEKLGDALQVYTPNSYVVRNIQARLDELKPKVKEKQLTGIDIAIKSAEDSIKLKKSSIADTTNQFDKLLVDINEYSELKSELDFSKRNLEGLISAKKQLQLDLAQDSKPWSVIKPPIFQEARIYPSYSKDLSKALLIGFFISLGLALLRDKFDFVFHSAEEVRNELKYPFLGHVPYVEYFKDLRDEQKSIVDDISLLSKNENIESYDRFFYQESLRNIYTSLRFLNSDNPIKVITMTSSLPKEGKSLINILLAKTLSEMDLKILQIDGDLRRPQIHSRLGLNNLTGLSNLLTNPELTLTDVKQTVPGFKNWDVITSGTKPPDPTRLLNSEKMRAFIKEVKESDKYDLVVFDTPPVIGLADSLLVSEKSDGLILLVSTNSVPKNLPKESINRSIKSGTHFLGIITNAVKKESRNILSNGYEDYAYAAYSSYGSDVDNENIGGKDAGSIAAKKMRDKNNQINIVREKVLEKLKIIFDKTLKWLDD